MRAIATLRNRWSWLVVAVVFAAVLIAPGPATLTPAQAFGGLCTNTSTGYVPLIDGIGLYDAGNQAPASFANEAPPIAPIGGVVGVVSLGMSNGSQEWHAFMDLVDSSSGVAGDIRLADGAIAGKTMSAWAINSGDVWGKAVKHINDAGIATNQVEVVWMKMGSRLGELAPTQDERIAQERGWLETIITKAAATFPNLKRIYISSRIYAGYSVSTNHEEPETGWGNGLSVRTVVADSVAGNTAVWTAWGPYIWADGLAGRSDGFIWECSDFESDGVHPSASGEGKVAAALWDFFTGDPTACVWFLADPADCGSSNGGGGGGGGVVAAEPLPATSTMFLPAARSSPTSNGWPRTG